MLPFDYLIMEVALEDVVWGWIQNSNNKKLNMNAAQNVWCVLFCMLRPCAKYNSFEIGGPIVYIRNIF